MFCGFYQIPEQPFGESPDPRFLYPTVSHSECITGLLQGIESGCRVQVLAAPPGLGKTTIANAVLGQLAADVDSAFVFYTIWSPSDLLGFILRELGDSAAAPDMHSRHNELQSLIRARAKRNRKVLAVLDEAHNLHSEVARELDALLIGSRGAFQLLLAGQPALVNITKQASFGRKIDWVFELQPLSAEDSIGYIKHRLRIAGHPDGEIFTAEALAKITQASEGTPRNINMICAHALEMGATAKKVRIDVDVIEEVLSRSGYASAETPVTTAVLMNGTYGASAPPRPAAPVAQPSGPAAPSSGIHQVEKRDQPETGVSLADVLRRWLETHSRSWSGTAGELHNRLQQDSAVSMEKLAISSPGVLSEKIQSSQESLRNLGVEVQRRSGPPAWWILRLPE
jgi:general secretion pathway protein A